jgi:energy-coupling factor transport system substrate-specific component
MCGREYVRRLVLIALAMMVAALVVQDGALATALGAGALVVAGVAWFESGTDSTRELAVIATLAAAAAAGRVLFAAVPGVQPVTVIAIVAGASLGARAGVATGALAAFVSNLFLGQGIWTPQQMLGWGACGAVGALLAPFLRNRWTLAAVAAVLGFAFSASMDVWLWYGFSPHTFAALAAVMGRGLWFDVSHAAGNVMIALAAGPELRRMLDRYGGRLKTVVVWA